MTLTARKGTAITAPDFGEFYRAHRDRLYRALALTIGDPGLGAEATDEAMTRALERWPDVSGYDNAPGWVYRVGFNWAVSRMRRTGHETGPLAVDAVWNDPDPADHTLLAAVAGLSVDHRSVVVLRYLLDWSTVEVAEALEIPTGTVKSRLSRALADLAERMEHGR